MLWMLVALLGCRSVDASEPAAVSAPGATEDSPPVSLYDHCRVAVLLDRKQNRAMAFRVTTNNEIDTATGVELTLARDDRFGADVNNQRAAVPFENAAFTDVLISDNNVFGQTPSDNPSIMPLIPGYQNDKTETTHQGLTGSIYVLDARPECKS